MLRIPQRNTFQLVLTTDGIRSFAFFRYQTIQWECGTRLTGDPITGLTDIPAHNALVRDNEGRGVGGGTVMCRNKAVY